MLNAAGNARLVQMFATFGSLTRLTDRFIAGEDLSTAMAVVKSMNSLGIVNSLDLLGEGVTAPEEAERATDGYVRLLEEISRNGVQSNISIKPTQLGLAIDPELCSRNLAKILATARELDNFVRIDMEGSVHTQTTIDVFREQLEVFGPRHVGIVIQSYLFRSENDVRELSQLGCNIRLCKGAYQEPASIAFQKKSDIDDSLLNLIEVSLEGVGFTAIASHDHNVIARATEVISRWQVPKDRYEVQMLYGVRRDYQIELKQEGVPMRVYVPFGTEWAPYFMRRLAERPANMLFVTRAIFRG
jgi:proline dehydrogenase